MVFFVGRSVAHLFQLGCRIGILGWAFFLRFFLIGIMIVCGRCRHCEQNMESSIPYHGFFSSGFFSIMDFSLSWIFLYSGFFNPRCVGASLVSFLYLGSMLGDYLDGNHAYSFTSGIPLPFCPEFETSADWRLDAMDEIEVGISGYFFPKVLFYWNFVTY